MRHLNTIQAAAELGVTAGTIRAMFHAGRIPDGWQVGGKQGRIRIPARAVERLKERAALPLQYPPLSRILKTFPKMLEAPRGRGG